MRKYTNVLFSIKYIPMIKRSNAIAIFSVMAFVIFAQSAVFTAIILNLPKPQKPHVILPEEMPIGSVGDLMVIVYNTEDTLEIGYWHGDTIEKDGSIHSYKTK